MEVFESCAGGNESIWEVKEESDVSEMEEIGKVV